MRRKNYQAIVTHFGDLGALQQLPGLAIQRLMEKGYGFGAEGDWKTAAMVRLMKIMSSGMKDAKGTSLMEDYTYNLVPGKEGILQSHMLEVCPSVADGKPAIKVCPLSMGEREDPARLVFTSKTGPGIATSLVDLGDRFRLIINDVDCKKVEKPMPKLPVGSAFWTPKPDLATGAEAWILAGGAHHTAFTYDLTAEQMGDWAAAMGIEAVYIDEDTTIRNFKNELRWNEIAFRQIKREDLQWEQQKQKQAILENRTALGIEFGSTRIKAVLVDGNNMPIASGGHEWENRYENGVWTYSLEDIWSGIQDCYQQMVKDVKEKYGIELTRVGAIGISAMDARLYAF